MNISRKKKLQHTSYCGVLVALPTACINTYVQSSFTSCARKKCLDVHFHSTVWEPSYITFKPVAVHLLNHLFFRGTHCDCSCLVWKFSNSDTCAKEERDNLRTLFMHFISINVLLAQDQKDGGNLNFLMKVISPSFIPILRVIRLCTIREWTWELSLWREMSYPREKEWEKKKKLPSSSLQVSQSRNLWKQMNSNHTMWM